MGAACSILLFIFLLSYTGYKISVLEERKAVDVLQSVAENYFEESDSFGADQGLQVAFAVYDRSLSKSTIQNIDPSYGRIQFEIHSWNTNERGYYQQSM